jgi:hypothetical protein
MRELVGKAARLNKQMPQAPAPNAAILVEKEELFMLYLVETKMFKAVPGGYIFQPPPPTTFHDTGAYLVNESQKTEILAITRAGGAISGRIVTFAAVALAVAAGVCLDKLAGAPAFISIFLAVCIWIIAQIGSTSFVMYLKWRQLQPVLAGLPRSDERLFPPASRHQLLFGTPSPLFVALYCAGFGFWLGYRFEQHPPFTDATSTIVLFGLSWSLFWAIRTLKTSTAARSKQD